MARDQAGTLEPRHRPHRAELSQVLVAGVLRQRPGLPCGCGVQTRRLILLHPASLTLFGEIEAGLAQHPLIAALPQMGEGGIEGV